MQFILVLLLILSLNADAQTSVFINEIHYDNVGMDAWEGVEIFAPSGTVLTGWKLYFYDGVNGTSYGTHVIYGIVPDFGGSGYGSLFVPSSVGIQNGSPDGIVLVDNFGTVVQFLSYEGVFAAVTGPAAGLTSVDIGVFEDGTGLAGDSLQLTGNGVNYEDFTWTSGPATPGVFGPGLTITNAGPTVADCIADPTVCGITPDPGDGSTQDGKDFCILNPDLCGISADPMDGSNKEGEQYCIDNPDLCGISVDPMDGSIQDGVLIGRGGCRDDPISCGIYVGQTKTEFVGDTSSQSWLFVEVGTGAGTIYGRGLHCSSYDWYEDRENCAALEPFGETIYLIPMPAAGWYFSSWGGHHDCTDSMVLAIDSKYCVAYFRKIN